MLVEGLLEETDPPFELSSPRSGRKFTAEKLPRRPAVRIVLGLGPKLVLSLQVRMASCKSGTVLSSNISCATPR